MSNIKVGSEITPLQLPPVTRHTLALYCGASGDHNPIHVDSDFAVKAGMPDVFAHGMLSMAYLGRMLTDWQPQSKLRTFTSRFVAITHVHDVITCTGTVVELFEEQGVQQARLSIAATTANGTQTLLGEAVVTL
ncbi:MaoC family dehydratase [Pseudomonas frederiksbergensis]|uniref:MaoC family dehydratase n=1 Tax=Pseudomonas frederiksbergensis TaxID=104087 RepID=UPI003D01F28C